MTPLQEWLDARDDAVLLAEGFDAALIGVAQVFTTLIAVYDYEHSIEILMTRDGMTRDEAIEFFDFNVASAYVGEQTPGFLVWRANEAQA